MDGRPLVSGASGQLGRLTAELLLAAGAQPILVTRTPEAVADLGCDTRFGDYGDPNSLRDAYVGAEHLLLISGSDLETRTEQHRAALAAAAAVGVRHVIYTSGLNPEPPNPAVISASHRATEQALAMSGLAWTVVRDSLYSEYQVAEARQVIAAGKLTHNRGDGRIAYVSREDCAAVAAAVLTGTGHEGRVYDVTGPELFTARELATLYGELGGCEVREDALDDDSFTELLAGALGGSNDEHARYGAELVASFGRSIRGGYMESRSDVVERLTGRRPRTLRSVLEAGL